MKRQLVIGGLVGIALGGLITASFAHGVLSWAEQDVPAAVDPPQVGGDEVDVSAPRSERGFAPHRPLRPGSDRIGRVRTRAGRLAAAPDAPNAPSV